MRGESMSPSSDQTSPDTIGEDGEEDTDGYESLPKPQMSMNGQPMMTRMNTAGYRQAGGEYETNQQGVSK